MEKTLNKNIDWLFSLIRIAGVAFPVASSLVQWQAELSSKDVLERVQKLEDPVSFLHEDIPELSKLIYQSLKENESPILSFDDEFYDKYSRSLAVIKSQGYIESTTCFGNRHPVNIFLCDASYIMYMCALAEDKSKMARLFDLVDSCTVGTRLDGNIIKNEIDLPLPVIQAMFDIFESKGIGYRSKEVGSAMYYAKA
ncbi:MAG: hypothetical protein Q7U66_10675 [Methylobacter sp.]|nr:hypothetical protein [Methylobacter sp.]